MEGSNGCVACDVDGRDGCEKRCAWAVGGGRVSDAPKLISRVGVLGRYTGGIVSMDRSDPDILCPSFGRERGLVDC